MVTLVGRGIRRTARAAVFTAVCLLPAVLGHASAGMPPRAAAVAVGGAVLWGAATCLAGSKRSLPQLTVAVAAVQLGLHLLFELTSASAHAKQAPDAANGDALLHTAPGTTVIGEWRMVLAHLLAGSAAAWWLRRGEQIVGRLRRWLHGTALRWTGRFRSADLLTAHGNRRARRADRLLLPGSSGWLLRHSVISRGPPQD